MSCSLSERHRVTADTRQGGETAACGPSSHKLSSEAPQDLFQFHLPVCLGERSGQTTGDQPSSPKPDLRVPPRSSSPSPARPTGTHSCSHSHIHSATSRVGTAGCLWRVQRSHLAWLLYGFSLRLDPSSTSFMPQQTLYLFPLFLLFPLFQKSRT